MTSEYDELLARLEDAKVECARLTEERDSAVAQAATASGHSADTRRAWNADSNRLTGSRDLMYESRQQERAKVRALTAQVVERDAVIELIDQYRKMLLDSPDLEWRGETVAADLRSALSQAPGDALAARDAVRDKTVRATALRDAAAESKLWSSKGLRDRADQEEL